MPISLQQVFQDKDFYQLPQEERHKVIARVDSDFAQLPLEEQDKAYLGLESRFKVSQSGQPQQSFGTSVKKESQYAVDNPATTAKNIGRTALGFVPYARFLDPETRKEFVQKSIESPWKGTADMLLGDVLPTLGVGAMAKVAGRVPSAIEKTLKFIPRAGKASLAEQAINKGVVGAGKVATGQVAKQTLLPEERTLLVNQLGKDTETRFGKVGQLSDEDLMRVKAEEPKQPTPTEQPAALKQPSVELTEPQVGKTTRERGFITSVKEKFPELETRISGQYIPKHNDALSMRARERIGKNIDEAEEFGRTNTNDEAVATVTELTKHYTEKASSNPTNKNLYLDKASDIAHSMAEKLTEAGRTVQAASLLGAQSPEGQLRIAARTINKFNETAPIGKKIPNLTPDQTNNILARAKKIKTMPDGRDKAKEFFKLQEGISKLVPTPTYKKIINIWKAGLLTGIKTSGLNTFSNLFHGVSETIKDVPASAVDSVASLFTGKRTLAMTTKGTGKGTAQGFEYGWDYLKTGFDERNIRAKLDTKKIHFGNGKLARAMQAYEETVFRIMGAEDQPFYYGAKARSLQSQAIAQAKNKGLKGNEAKLFIENVTQNPTDDMLKYAVDDAETAVFQNKTVLSKVGKAIQDIPGGEVIVPFSRTPSAVAMQLVNYSPVGVVNTIIRNAGKGKFDQRLFSQGMGRAITGTGAMAIGGALYKGGLLELGIPKTEREKKLWELEGRKTNSIKVNDKWRSANVLGPLGYTLIVGGYFKRELDKSGSPTAAMSQAIIGGGKSLTEQTFLKGTSSMLEALNDPERRGKALFTGMAGSTVPTIVADIARANDETERRVEGFGQAVKARVPGLRNTLEPKVNVFGQDLPRYGGNVLEVMADPTRPSKVRNDIVVDELRRLDKQNYKVTPTLLGNREGYKSLTPEQNTQLWKTSGRLTYNSVFNDIAEKDYKNLGDEDKAKIIESRTKYSKDLARASMIDEIIKSTKTPEERKQKVEGLYEEKFINQDVLKIYDELNQ